MSIATVDDLAALDPGTEIVITSPVNGKATWSKADDGRFRHVATGAFVHPGVFVGSIVAGQVVLASEDPPQVGEVFRTNSGTYLYVILEVTTEEDLTVIHAGRFRNGSWYGLHRLNMSNFAGTALTRVIRADRPDWLTLATAMAEVIHSQNQTIRERNTQITALQAAPVPANLVADLHRYAAQVVDDEFDSLLSNHNLARTRPHTSVVSITGTTIVEGEVVMNAANLGADYEIDDIQASVTWSRSEEIVREGLGCTCAEITEEMITPFLPANYRNLNWDANCL